MPISPTRSPVPSFTQDRTQKDKKKSLSAKELMPSNCGAGEDS